MSTLKEKHNQHIFTITTELDPPKSASSSVTEAQVVKVAPYVDAVNIADCPMAKMRMSPIALSSIIQSRYQVESIFHLTCRDRNVIGLQAELLGAYALGVHNILTLTGDPPSIGDHPDAKGVFEVDSTGLIEIAKALNEGHDMMGHELGEAADFYIGTTATPAPMIWTRKSGGWKERRRPAPSLSRPSQFTTSDRQKISLLPPKTFPFPSSSALSP